MPTSTKLLALLTIACLTATGACKDRPATQPEMAEKSESKPAHAASKSATGDMDQADTASARAELARRGEVHGSESDDKLVGGSGNDQLTGGGGNDTLLGGEGEDFLIGGLGNDELDGGLGDDRLMAGEGDDVLRGDRGNDLLQGGEGNDRLEGGFGDDELFGQDGDDVLIPGRGADKLIGGSGADLFVFLPENIEAVRDEIMDLKPEEGDAIDLTELLAKSEFKGDGTAASLRHHLSMVGSVLRFDPAGTGERFEDVCETRLEKSLEDLLASGALRVKAK